MPKRTEKRTGFTLVEMLVVIAIIGILMAMLLPAVNMAREWGRAAQCSAKLHNIQIALDAHHAKWGCYPPGLPSCTPPPNQYYSGGTKGALRGSIDGSWCQGPNWLTALLPFMGYQAYFDNILLCLDSEAAAADECEHASPEYESYGSEELFEFLRCPSGPVMTEQLGYNNSNADLAKKTALLELMAKGNYAANFGKDVYAIAVDDPTKGPQVEALRKFARGAFQINTVQGSAAARNAIFQGGNPQGGFVSSELNKSAYAGRWKLGSTYGVRKAQFKDGLTQTLLVSEVVGWDSKRDIRGAWVVASPGASVFTARTTPNSIVPDNLLVCGTYCFSEEGDADRIPDGHPLTCTLSGGDGNWPKDSEGTAFAAARSMHPGGVHAVMGDGAVRFFGDIIDPEVWRALATRSGPQAETTLDYPF